MLAVLAAAAAEPASGRKLTFANRAAGAKLAILWLWKELPVGKTLLTSAFLISGLALTLRHYHHISLSVICFCTAVLAGVFGLLLYKRHPLSDLLDDLRRQAD